MSAGGSDTPSRDGVGDGPVDGPDDGLDDGPGHGPGQWLDQNLDHPLPSVDLEAPDGHRFALLRRTPVRPRAHLLWLPALGVAARHYLPFAEALAARGVDVCLHEWRGHGSSSVRAGRTADWGYRTLLEQDLPVSLAAALGERRIAGTDTVDGGRGAERGGRAPTIVGGHSLGGQLAALALALNPAAADRLWLAASGAPYWRTFPGPRGWMLPWAYRFLWWLAEARGALPGRAVGFGGREARGVMRDWARTGLSGRYAAAGMAIDLEAALSGVRTPVEALRLADDWLVPDGSLRYLLGKMRPASERIAVIDADTLGARADHFAWMRHPDAVAEAFVHAAGITDITGITRSAHARAEAGIVRPATAQSP